MSMTQALRHRGPDHQDVTVLEDGPALGHARLAILDLSPEGFQPMNSADGRWTVVFNGEIYNYRDLARHIESARRGWTWRGHSDTEVLVEAMSLWGFPRTIDSIKGMFAIAAWDSASGKLWLARDRGGEKPLYWGTLSDGSFVFASELKAIAATKKLHVTTENISTFLRYGYLPFTDTIYRDIHRLAPGSILEVELSGSRFLTQQHTYFDRMRTALAWQDADPPRSEKEILDRLEELLTDSVSRMLMSDVPLGAFLSGGIDSSIVVSLMKRLTDEVHTFTIGFSEKRYDEAPYAADVAKYLGTTHHEHYVTPEDVLSLVPKLPQIYDEPFADSSSLPTLLLSHFTRQHVTVALSGDGGDELFGGYRRYLEYPMKARLVKRIPAPVRKIVGKALLSLKPHQWNRIYQAVARMLPEHLASRKPGYRIANTANLLKSDDPVRALAALSMSQGSYYGTPSAPENTIYEQYGSSRPLDLMMWDWLYYLPEVIFVKVDRASMSVSLETRTPFLYPDVIEYAFSLPPDLKTRHNINKYLLRQLAYRLVPRNLLDRPKRGFGAPVGLWLRTSLRPWTEDLINSASTRPIVQYLAEEEGLDVHRIYREHLEERENHTVMLWRIVTLISWFDVWSPTL